MVLILHKIFCQMETVIEKKKKKRNQGEGRVKEKGTKKAALTKTGTPSIDISKQIYWWEEISINNNQAQLAHFSLLGLIALASPYLIGVHTHAC